MAQNIITLINLRFLILAPRFPLCFSISCVFEFVNTFHKSISVNTKTYKKQRTALRVLPHTEPSFVLQKVIYK